MNACKHGQLARSCNVCELEKEREKLAIALLEEISWRRSEEAKADALRAERDALKRERDQLHIEIVSGDRTMTAVPTRLLDALMAAQETIANHDPSDLYAACNELEDWLASHRPEQKEKQG